METLDDKLTRSGIRPGATVNVGPQEPLPQLILAFGPEPSRLGERVVLSGPVVVGRDEQLALFPGGPIIDGRLSRRHAELVSKNGTWNLTDLGSHNGTYLNGDRLTVPTTVSHGDLIRVGGHLLLFKIERIPPMVSTVPEFTGISLAIAEAQQTIATHASTARAVLVTGETGTGKEVVAEALHSASKRTGKFIPVDCPAIPEKLIESELFGYEKGAFSDARQSKRGLFEAAHRGTLFLDEVGELPMEAQATLLRTLESRRIRRVGGRDTTGIDALIVAATNRDLTAEVRNGGFRQDLLARLASLVVTIPPLRHRKEDIPVLFLHFLASFELAAKQIDAVSMEQLTLIPWPFNARDLRSIAELAAPQSTSPDPYLEFTPAINQRLDFCRSLSQSPEPDKPTIPPTKAELQALMDKHGGNIAAVARALGKGREQIYRWLRR